MEEPVKVADILVEKVLDHMALIDKVAETRSLSRGLTNKITIYSDEYKSQRTYMEDEKKIAEKLNWPPLGNKRFHLHCRLRSRSSPVVLLPPGPLTRTNSRY